MTYSEENKDLKIALACKTNNIGELRLTIPVVNQEGCHIGNLECIDRGFATDERIIADLTDWRQKFMRYFLTQFDATASRTKSWLENIVIPSADRMLFIIKLPTGESVGNIGICKITEISGELDNLIRGRKGGDARLIYHSELALLSWMFGYLQFQTSSLHVFSNNRPTIRLHSSVGFSVLTTTPLTVRKSPDSTEYLLNSTEGDPVDFSYLEMSLDRATFLATHPWVLDAYSDYFR